MSFNIKISERKIKMAFDRLIENIVKTQNPSVVGLDPKLDYVPEYIKEKKFKKYGKTLGCGKGYMGIQQDYNRRDTRYLPCYQATGCIL